MAKSIFFINFSIKVSFQLERLPARIDDLATTLINFSRNTDPVEYTGPYAETIPPRSVPLCSDIYDGGSQNQRETSSPNYTSQQQSPKAPLITRPNNSLVDEFSKIQEENNVPQWLFGRDSNETVADELRRYIVDNTIPYVIFTIF